MSALVVSFPSFPFLEFDGTQSVVLRLALAFTHTSFFFPCAMIDGVCLGNFLFFLVSFYRVWLIQSGGVPFLSQDVPLSQESILTCLESMCFPVLALFF